MNKTKIGIVGAGIVSVGYHIPVLFSMNDVEIKWICDTDIEKAKKISKKYSINSYGTTVENLESVDIVLLAIPLGTRDKIIDYCSLNNINIFLEKPIAKSIDDHKKLIEISNNKNIEIGVGLMRKSYYSSLALEEIVESKIFGNIKKIFASEGAIARGLNSDDSYYQNNADLAGGGILIETGSHIIDQVFNIIKPKEISITAAEFKEFENIDLDTFVESTVICDNQENEIYFNLYLSKLNDTSNRIIIYFENHILSCSIAPDSPVTMLDKNLKKICNLNYQYFDCANEIYQAFYLEWKSFTTQVKRKKSGAFCIKNNFSTTDFIDKAYNWKKDG